MLHLQTLSCTVSTNCGKSLSFSRFLVTYWNHKTVLQMHVWSNLWHTQHLWMVCLFLQFLVYREACQINISCRWSSTWNLIVVSVFGVHWQLFFVLCFGYLLANMVCFLVKCLSVFDFLLCASFSWQIRQVGRSCEMHMKANSSSVLFFLFCRCHACGEAVIKNFWNYYLVIQNSRWQLFAIIYYVNVYLSKYIEEAWHNETYLLKNILQRYFQIKNTFLNKINNSLII